MEDKKSDLYLITWRDAFGCSPEWSELPDILRRKSIECVSIGWIIAKNEKSITLVPHVTTHIEGQNTQYCGDMTIPRSAIESVQNVSLMQKRLEAVVASARKDHEVKHGTSMSIHTASKELCVTCKALEVLDATRFDEIT
jgi:hypothetical protein